MTTSDAFIAEANIPDGADFDAVTAAVKPTADVQCCAGFKQASPVPNPAATVKEGEVQFFAAHDTIKGNSPRIAGEGEEVPADARIVSVNSGTSITTPDGQEYEITPEHLNTGPLAISELLIPETPEPAPVLDAINDVAGMAANMMGGPKPPEPSEGLVGIRG